MASSRVPEPRTAHQDGGRDDGRHQHRRVDGAHPAGALMAEHYPRGMDPGTRHLLMSVSKSLVGVVIGAMVASGAARPRGAGHGVRAGTGGIRLRRGDRAAPAGHALGHRSSPRTTSTPRPRSGCWSRRSAGRRAITGRPAHHVRLPADAEPGQVRTADRRVPQLRDRRARVGVRGRDRPADARVSASGLVADRGRERREDRPSTPTGAECTTGACPRRWAIWPGSVRWWRRGARR